MAKIEIAFEPSDEVVILHDGAVVVGKVQEVAYTRNIGIETTRYKLDLGNGKQVFRDSTQCFKDKKGLIASL